MNDAYSFKTKKVVEIDDDEKKAWEDLLRKSKIHNNPHYAVSFISILAEFQSDIYAGFILEENKIVGVVTYKRVKGKKAVPVSMCDFQGIVSAEPLEVDIKAMLRGFDLCSWEFEAIDANEKHSCLPNRFQSNPVYIIDLTAGCEAFEKHLIKAHKQWMSKLFSLERKLAKTLGGGYRFVFEESNEGLLEKIIEWKAQRVYGKKSFSPPVVSTIYKCSNVLKSEPKAMISSLYVNDELIGAIFSLRQGAYLYPWFISFNLLYEKYSPGRLLIIYLARSAEEHGVNKIDLGPGGERYKETLSNKKIDYMQGAYELLSVYSVMRQFLWTSKNKLKKVLIRLHLLSLVHKLREIFATKKEVKA